ncbi:coiled-coil domain-containing protein 191 [Strigops habroptila]|uniref:coiled-coil domain-containing protein 191 n=1 Tax=Strigops habroptila TaxID=2489341 RepID=UPI0011D02C3B|nr:coiled-coil domain-containing protein 191 [Strigops habroptila]
MIAQELLSNWMKSKMQLDLMSDGEEEVFLLEKPSAAPLKYERFDDLCSYLEYKTESSSVQEYLQHLLQDEAVSYGIVEGLRLEDIKETSDGAETQAGERKPNKASEGIRASEARTVPEEITSVCGLAPSTGGGQKEGPEGQEGGDPEGNLEAAKENG